MWKERNGKFSAGHKIPLSPSAKKKIYSFDLV
jgi:hypothetical protein